MISQSNNRVKAIKSRFENLNGETADKHKWKRSEAFKTTQIVQDQLFKQDSSFSSASPIQLRRNDHRKPSQISLPSRQAYSEENSHIYDPLLQIEEERLIVNDSESSGSEEQPHQIPPTPNTSYLYCQLKNKNDPTDVELHNRPLSRQLSDPGKKLHRSHAFRCDRSQKIGQSPKRHSSCNGRTENNEAPTLRIGEKPRLSRDRLRKLGNLLEDRMRKENFTLNSSVASNTEVRFSETFQVEQNSEPILPTAASTPDEDVPQHILDQYAKVLKPKKRIGKDSPVEEQKQDAFTDSGVSSETENVQEFEPIEKGGRLKRLKAQFESTNEESNEKTEHLRLNIRKTLKSDDFKVPLKAINFENKENVLDVQSNLSIPETQSLSSSSETIRRLERKNPHLILTDTLKKALKQPLPPGPPPKKPPRTFINSQNDSITSSDLSPTPECKFPHPESSKKGKKDSRQMLEKLELALQKHNDSTKIIIPRSNASLNTSETDSQLDDVKLKTTSSKPKEMHYLCTEILDITNRSLLPNVSGENNISLTISNCFNSLNCGTTQNRSSSSIAYNRMSSDSSSARNSLTNVCCSCSSDSLDNVTDIPADRPKFSTFFGGKSETDLCKKCGLNTFKEEKFQCHLNCKCKDKIADGKSTFFIEPIDKVEHIYDEPFVNSPPTGGCGEMMKKSITQCDITTQNGSTDGNVVRSKWEHPNDNVLSQSRSYGVLNAVSEFSANLNALKGRTDSRSLEDIRSSALQLEDQKIYDIPCDPSRSPSPEALCTSSPIAPSFDSLRRGFENGFPKESTPKPFKTAVRPRETSSIKKPRQALETSLTRDLVKSQKPKVLVKIPSDSKIKLSSQSTESVDDFRGVKKALEKRFATEIKKKSRYEKNTGCLGNGISLSVKRQDRTKDQLDVDRENLNRLMNEIYETVSAACRMERVSRDDEGKPSKFPVDHADGSSSEESIRLTRNLTEKRKTYVRRVSSRAAYLEPQTRPSVRFRHQTSVCSYKSDNVDPNMYATFRSWKSFKNSQNSLSKSNASISRRTTEFKRSLTDTDCSVTGFEDLRRDSTDSKFNLTDSKGNLLSLKDDFKDLEGLDDLSIDDKAGCLDIDLPLEARERGLFDICLLVGLNHMTGQAYVKSVFPEAVTVTPHIENLVFPETLNTEGTSEPSTRPSRLEYDLDAVRTQCYSLVLTNERGERSFGYCRRVLPEGASFCLPLAYCLITRYRAPGFYYKVLQEIESHHGSSDTVLNATLQQLFENDFPQPGEMITVTKIKSPKNSLLQKNSVYRNSVNLGDILKSKTLPDQKKSPRKSDSSEFLVDDRPKSTDRIPDYYDIENNNSPKKIVLSLPTEVPHQRYLKRPIEPRMDEDNLSVLLDSLGASLLIKVFGSLLLERKVVLISDSLSQLSSCIEALQSVLYPFVWQQPLISTIPAELRKDILEAPLPILAGMLKSNSDWGDMEDVIFEEGMLVDLSESGAKVIFNQGDESSILPSVCSKTLKTSLQLESAKSTQKGESEFEKTRNVLISEAFLRFFVDIFAAFWQYFAVKRKSVDEDVSLRGEGDVYFEREAFIKNASSKQIQYFLEWFTETAMFNHFVQNMTVCYPARQQLPTPTVLDYGAVQGLVDTPLPNYYEVFDERVTRKQLNMANSKKTLKNEQRSTSDTSTKSNYKNVVNRKVKLLKNKLRDLVN